MTSEAASYQKHCPGCFQLKGGVPVCPHCGYDESTPRSPIFLPHGTILGTQYRVGRVLGRPGGFGITYLGWDVNLQQRVAIKEYLPREIAQRMPNSLEVDVHTADDRRGFEFGKEQFLREARIVAKLDHPNIVRVRNFFNANSTAYLVMDYYEGMSLGDYLSTVRARLEPELAVPLIKPILEGLQYVHERGLVHRDLKPHNIYLAAIGRPIVLDFGAARQAAGDRVQSLSVVLTEGYAPLEQYQRRAVQGPWTDVYGVAATLYRMILGAAPPIALDRIGRDPVDDAGWAGLPQALVPAMRMALAVRPSDRFQIAAEFRAALDRFLEGSTQPPALVPAPAPFVPVAEPLNVAAEPVTAMPTAVAPPRPELKAPPPAIAVPVEQTIATVEVAPPTITAPKPAARTVMPPMPAAPPPGPLPSARPPLGVLATAPGEPSQALPLPSPRHAPKLHRRALEIPPVLTPKKKAGPNWGLLMALMAALVLGYVVLNPPGGKPRPKPSLPAAARSVAEPAPEVAAVPPPAPDTPLQIPDTVSLPGGEVRLVERSVDAAAAPTTRSVRVSPIRVGRTEVTFAQFRDFVQRSGYDNPRWQNYPCESAGGRLPDWKDPGYAQLDNSPVVCVSWSDAEAYVQWLSRETGQNYRLPTEAEWEYAARAGTETTYWWGREFNPGMAACQSCPPKVPTQPSATGSFPPNPFGLNEMLGNVREWTCSRYESYSTASASLCTTPNEAGRISVRGGSWQQEAAALGSGVREAYEPYRRNVWTGFRIVQALDVPAEGGAR